MNLNQGVKTFVTSNSHLPLPLNSDGPTVDCESATLALAAIFTQVDLDDDILCAQAQFLKKFEF